MITMKVGGPFSNIPEIQSIADGGLHPFKVARMIGLDVKGASWANQFSCFPEVIDVQKTIFPLGLSRPRVGEIKVEMIDFTSAKHKLNSLGVSAKENQILDGLGCGFFHSAVNCFKFPIDTDIVVFGVERRPLADNVSGIATYLDVEFAAMADARAVKELFAPFSALCFSVVV